MDLIKLGEKKKKKKRIAEEIKRNVGREKERSWGLAFP